MDRPKSGEPTQGGMEDRERANKRQGQAREINTVIDTLRGFFNPGLSSYSDVRTTVVMGNIEESTEDAVSPPRREAWIFRRSFDKGVPRIEYVTVQDTIESHEPTGQHVEEDETLKVSTYWEFWNEPKTFDPDVATEYRLSDDKLSCLHDKVMEIGEAACNPTLNPGISELMMGVMREIQETRELAAMQT